MTLKVVSLFSGIGGMDLGLEATGHFITILFSENNKFCDFCKLKIELWCRCGAHFDENH